MMIRKALLALSTLVALLAGALFAPAPASAALPTDCPAGTICLYKNASDPYQKTSTTSDFAPRNTCIASSTNPGNSFVMNKTSVRWFLFRDSLCAGAHVEIAPLTAGQIQALGCCNWDNTVIAIMRTSTTT